MKRFLFIATLLFSFVTQNALADSYKNIETKVNGDLHYMIAYNDNLKQDVKTFWVWHLPEKNKELFKDTKIEENVSMSNLDKINVEAAIEYLAVSCFGEDKVFDSKGRSNISNITYKIHIHSGKVYLVNILFYGDVYKLITDEEILNFIEKINLMRIKVNDIEKYDENAYAIRNFMMYDKDKGYYPIKEKK